MLSREYDPILRRITIYAPKSSPEKQKALEYELKGYLG